MSRNIKQLSVFILIIITQISCAQRKPKLYAISGTVTSTQAYCGGARPSDEMLAKITAPKPIAAKKLFIKKGESNSKNNTVIRSFITDDQGHFSINLEKGSYCIIEEYKTVEFKIPLTNKENKWDTVCLQNEYERCDFQLTVTTKEIDTVTVNYSIPCQWNTPCLDFSGPLPLAAPPRH